MNTKPPSLNIKISQEREILGKNWKNKTRVLEEMRRSPLLH